MPHVPISFDVQRYSEHVESAQAYQKQVNSFEDLLSADQKLKILERDKYTCSCCGFKSEKYQKIHFINGNPNDHAPENLTTTCIYCNQCFHIDAVATMKSGVLIWLPEIEQTMLHHIARAIYVARISQGDMAEISKTILEKIMNRREEAKKRIGTDDPLVLAGVLKDYLEDRHYDKRNEKLAGIRLMPLDRRIVKEGGLEFNQFPQILAYWRSKDGPFAGKMPRTWLDRYKEILSTQAA